MKNNLKLPTNFIGWAKLILASLFFISLLIVISGILTGKINNSMDAKKEDGGTDSYVDVMDGNPITKNSKTKELGIENPPENIQNDSKNNNKKVEDGQKNNTINEVISEIYINANKKMV